MISKLFKWVIKKKNDAFETDITAVKLLNSEIEERTKRIQQATLNGDEGRWGICLTKDGVACHNGE